MRSLFAFLLMSYALLILRSHQISPDFLPSDSFEVISAVSGPDMILHNNKFILILSDSTFDLSELKMILLLLGYDSRLLLFSSPTFLKAKSSVDSFFTSAGIPSLIIIVGDENMLPPYRERRNPYTKRLYSTDYDYGLIEGGPAFVSVSRIPASSQPSLDLYLENLMKFLTSTKTTNTRFLAPFYDFNSDSVEDYLYSTLSYYASSKINCSQLLMETNSPYPKYLFDLRELDDSLKKPANDFDVGITDLSSDSPLLLAYRGHGNPISTVLPDLSLPQISLASLSEGGAFVSFTCLLSAFDSYTSGFHTCFAESILFLNGGFVFSLGFSSETFYQYNNFMFNIFFDHYNDAVYAPISSDTNANLLDACRDCSSKLLSVFGFNDYSACQISSIQFLGIPLLSLKKTFCDKPYTVQNTLFSDDTLIKVTLLKDAPFFLSSETSIYDSLPRIAGLYTLKAENLKEGSELFASSYFNGILFVDTIRIIQGGISCSGVALSDSSGDNDNIIESGERVTFSFNLEPPIDSCALSCGYPGFDVILKPDSFGRYSYSFTIPKDCEEVRLTIDGGGKSFFWAFESFMYVLRLEQIKSMDSFFIFSEENHQMMLEFLHDPLFGGTCTLRIIPSTDYKTDCETAMVMKDFGSCVFFREFLFFSDSFDLKIEFKTNLFTDTLFSPFVCARKNSLFIYDPADQYFNSDFASFLRDSLKCLLTFGKKLDSSKFFPSNIFAFGIYPNNDILDSFEASYISKAASLNSAVMVDGGDAFGYDKAGENLLGLFGLTSASDGETVYSGNCLQYSPFQIEAFADTTIKFVDLYASCNPILVCGEKILGSAFGNRIAQSYPLTKVSCSDINWLYYLYASFILDFRLSVEYDDRVNLSYRRSLSVKNTSSSPLMLNIVSFPSFFDSVTIENSRIILPDSSAEILFFLRRNSPGFISELLFSSGFDTMSASLFYSPVVLPKTLCASVVSSSFVFECPYAGEVILPPKASKSCFVKRKNNMYFILGETSCLLGDTIVLVTDEEIILVSLPSKFASEENYSKADVYYSVLGARVDLHSNGIYFSGSKKTWILK
ncbi:MAG: C25 family cysteine peptidase [bacterium]|nr:C25 family cysteine peptidase [bacterium]